MMKREVYLNSVIHHCYLKYVSRTEKQSSTWITRVKSIDVKKARRWLAVSRFLSRVERILAREISRYSRPMDVINLKINLFVAPY